MSTESGHVEVYCSCRMPYDETRFMIECEVCKEWFHGSCVGIEEVQAPDIEIFHCPECEKTHGPLVFKFKKSKKKKNQKNYTDENGDKKSSQKKTKKKRKRKGKEEQKKQMLNLDILHQHTTDTLKQVVQAYDKSIYNFPEDDQETNAILKVRLPKAGAYVDSKETGFHLDSSVDVKPINVSSRFERKDVSDEISNAKDGKSPPKKKKKGAVKKTAVELNQPSTEKHGTLKLKLSYKPKTAQSVDSSFAQPEPDINKELSQRLNIPTIRGGLNGSIADILEASGYGAEPELKIDTGVKGSGPTIMSDAIQGMLSMSQESSGSLQIDMDKRKRKRSQENLADSDEEEKLMADCYRDSEFVYPSLELSDEEESYVYNNGKKNKRDITWNPKARVNVTVANPIRPVRVGVKKEAIESSLAATAKKLAETPATSPGKEPLKSEKPKERYSLESEPQVQSESGSAFRPGIRKVIPQEPSSPPKSRKPKKGTTTAKQRLGKILKIHKYVH